LTLFVKIVYLVGDLPVSYFAGPFVATMQIIADGGAARAAANAAGQAVA
jgi:hypothetical protein